LAKTASEIPNKLFYKIGEVCEITDTQPYVLRFWESEFPQLAPRKNRSGQRVYQRKDIDTVIRIKKLLYEEEYTIAGARKRLDEEPHADSADGGNNGPSASRSAGPEPRGVTRPVRAPAKDHPADSLAARTEEAPETGSSSGRKTGPVGPTEKEARLEAALAEVKKSLQQIASLLKKE